MKIVSRKSAAPKQRRLSRAKPAPDISPEEVDWLERLALEHRKSEQAWLQMTASAGEDEDRWSTVEEQLLVKSRQRDPSPRRWKYFGK
ncbi:MAG: hypothetical protein HY921_06150 [Elusimicrobia bacterium]|nr:hypothetical protein [Elusimicrobiota bacterium]